MAWKWTKCLFPSSLNSPFNWSFRFMCLLANAKVESKSVKNKQKVQNSMSFCSSMKFYFIFIVLGIDFVCISQKLASTSKLSKIFICNIHYILFFPDILSKTYLNYDNNKINIMFLRNCRTDNKPHLVVSNSVLSNNRQMLWKWFHFLPEFAKNRWWLKLVMTIFYSLSLSNWPLIIISIGCG